MTPAPTERFSDRVDNYIKYRPGYPPEVLDYLQTECGLSGTSVIADVGAGTGIFTTLLIQCGYKVIAVEPNEAMREAAVKQLGGNPNFVATNGTAEATTLDANSVDLIVCAQAFHWFDAEKTRNEFGRILKQDAQVALIWNNRLADADGFSVAYENLLRQDSVDYNKVNHRNIGDINFKAFFKDGIYKTAKFPNVQVFDEEGLLGRAYSSSYVPPENTQAGQKFKAMLKDIFTRYNENGRVKFHYQTEVYLGRA